MCLPFQTLLCSIVQPDAFGMDWSVRFVMIPVIPNLYKMHKGTLQLPQ